MEMAVIGAGRIGGNIAAGRLRRADLGRLCHVPTTHADHELAA